MVPRLRFDCPSARLNLRALLNGSRHVLAIGFVLALVTHLLTGQLRGRSAQQGVTKPLTTQFVKRAPRLTKPLEMKKRPQPRQRRLERRMVAVQAKATSRERAGGVRASEVVRNLARPRADLQRSLGSQEARFEIAATAQAIEGSKEPANKLDVSLEMLDIEALDTGQYHAMVVEDPRDKRAIKGFFRVATPYPPTLQFMTNNMVGTSTAMSAVARAMNRYTDIRVELWKSFPIHSQEVFKTPFIFLTANRGFDLTTAELENLGKYALCGGFVMADDDNARAFMPVDTSFHRMFKEALATQGQAQRRDWDFFRLPDDHPLYHCFFDFSGLPPGCDEWWEDIQPTRDHLIGVTMDDRLVGLISSEDFTTIWTCWGTGAGDYRPYDRLSSTRHLQLGVNFVVFALTQEGSITHQVMDGIR